MRGRRLLLAMMLGIGATMTSGADAVAQSSPTPTSAPSTSAAGAREAALRALAGRLHLPLLDEAVAIFSTQLRRTLPTYFVNGVGQNANLGPGWRPGDPVYDQMLREVNVALTDEEVRNGPLLKLDRSDLLYAVNVPWTRDDIAFVHATLDTDLGREAERALDAKVAQQTIATLKRRVALGPARQGVVESFAELDDRAQAQFGDAMLMLLALRGADPQRAARLQRLVESVTIAPSDAIGQRIVDRLSRRLLDAAAAQLPNLLGLLAGFRTGP